MTPVRVISSLTISALAFGAGFSASAAASAALQAEARKVCLEQYNAEKNGGTVPAGMSKSKYLSQCTRGYVRNAELEAKLAQATAGQAAGGTTAISNKADVKPKGQ